MQSFLLADSNTGESDELVDEIFVLEVLYRLAEFFLYFGGADEAFDLAFFSIYSIFLGFLPAARRPGGELDHESETKFSRGQGV